MKTSAIKPHCQSQFPNTAEALVVFDATAEAREAAWSNAMTDADVDAAQAADKQALAEVQVAFYEDTVHINCLDNCMLTDIEWLKEMAS